MGKNADEYLEAKDYLGHPIAEDGFSKFFREENKEYYFAYIEEGAVVLRSEGYTTETGRNNGIVSVKKNEKIEKQYKLLEIGKGKWVLSLRAGNHKEIAITCPQNSEAAAWALLPSKRVAAALALKTVAKKTKKSQGTENDYLVCEAYKGHERNLSFPNFSTFNKDGLHYFAMLDEEGNVALRSEGYTTVAARNNGIRSVIKNKDIEKRRVIIERFGYYFVILKAGNHQEIAKSCALTTEASALGLFGLAVPIVAGTIPIVQEETTPEIIERPSPISAIDKEDDYLVCVEYKDRFISDKRNNVALFKYKDDQYYFALYNENREVKLRSEGFRTIEERDEELSAVLRLHDKSEMYERIQKGTHYIDILKDETGREIGRSCIQKEKAGAIIPPVIPVIPVETVVGAAAVITSDSIVPNTNPEPVVTTPITGSAVTSATGSGCMDWKWLLLVLLLLLLLLWFCRGCMGCVGSTTGLIPPVGEVENNTEMNTEANAGTVVIESPSGIDAVTTTATKETVTEESLTTKGVAAAEFTAAAIAVEAAVTKELALRPKYNLESIYYDYEKWNLRDASTFELDRMVKILKNDESLQGEFLGHTDTRGSQKLNDRLSRKRAQAALNYVVSQGISKSRLSWRKFSAENPKAKNDTESEQKLQLNRRVDLRIIKNEKVLENTETGVRSVD